MFVFLSKKTSTHHAKDSAIERKTKIGSLALKGHMSGILSIKRVCRQINLYNKRGRTHTRMKCKVQP